MKRQTVRSFFGLPVLGLFILSIAAHAQPDERYQSKRDMIKSYKIAFITDRLALTPEEAQQFWPLYNEYESSRETVQREMFKNDKLDDLDIDLLTEEEATEMADNQIIKAQKLLDLRKEYHMKFKSVLPVKKVLKLYQAERDFQHELIKKIRQDRDPGARQKW